MVDYQGYGRSRDRSDELYGLSKVDKERSKFRRQVVGYAKHVAGNEKYRWLNDSICGISGEVRTPPAIPVNEIKQAFVKLVFSIGEIIWEPPPE